MENLNLVIEKINKGTYHESQIRANKKYRETHRQHYNQYQKELYEKQMADPEFRKVHNEKKRIYQALRRERLKMERA